MSPPEITEIIGQLPNASNATLLARDTGGSLVVHKPERGERPLWDFDHGTLAAREVLTYEVATAAGWSFVPETRLVSGPYGRGSAQTFIDEDLAYDPSPLINEGDHSLWPVAVLDLIVNNADRKAGHIIAEQESGAMYCIDHGLTFHAEPKLRTVLWAFSGRAIPAEALTGVQAVAIALEGELGARLAELLSEEEAEATRLRVADILATPIHPEPPTDRHAVPWPIW